MKIKNVTTGQIQLADLPGQQSSGRVIQAAEEIIIFNEDAEKSVQLRSFIEGGQITVLDATLEPTTGTVIGDQTTDAVSRWIRRDGIDDLRIFVSANTALRPDFTNLQAAIDGAPDGASIIVGPGDFADGHWLLTAPLVVEDKSLDFHSDRSTGFHRRASNSLSPHIRNIAGPCFDIRTTDATDRIVRFHGLHIDATLTSSEEAVKVSGNAQINMSNVLIFVVGGPALRILSDSAQVFAMDAVHFLSFLSDAVMVEIGGTGAYGGFWSYCLFQGLDFDVADIVKMDNPNISFMQFSHCEFLKFTSGSTFAINSVQARSVILNRCSSNIVLPLSGNITRTENIV